MTKLRRVTTVAAYGLWLALAGLVMVPSANGLSTVHALILQDAQYDHNCLNSGSGPSYLLTGQTQWANLSTIGWNDRITAWYRYSDSPNFNWYIAANFNIYWGSGGAAGSCFWQIQDQFNDQFSSIRKQ